MAVGDYRLSLEGVFLYGVAGAPAGTESDNVDDVNLDLSAEMVTWIRRHKKWEGNKPTFLKAQVTARIANREGDPLLTAVKTAFMARGKMAIYPKDAASGEGLDCDVYVESFKRVEQNNAIIGYDVTWKPTDEQREPAWV